MLCWICYPFTFDDQELSESIKITQSQSGVVAPPRLSGPLTEISVRKKVEIIKDSSSIFLIQENSCGSFIKMKVSTAKQLTPTQSLPQVEKQQGFR